MASIGQAVAQRALLADLRAMGEVSGGPPPFSKADRSRFLSALDQAVHQIRRRPPACTPSKPGRRYDRRVLYDFTQDRKSVVWGTGVSVIDDTGGRSIIKKQKN